MLFNPVLVRYICFLLSVNIFNLFYCITASIVEFYIFYWPQDNFTISLFIRHFFMIDFKHSKNKSMYLAVYFL